MAALTTDWQIITDIDRITDDYSRIYGTNFHVGVSVGDVVEITGVGNSTLYEGLQFPIYATTTGSIDIDWRASNLTAPADDWANSGMIRLQPGAESRNDDNAIISFNPHELAATDVTTDGETGEFGIENALNSNRAQYHKLGTGAKQVQITLPTDSLVNSVALPDFVASLATTVRIRGQGLDVQYPAFESRYTISGYPPIGYPNVSVDGHNSADPIPHFLRYIPDTTTNYIWLDFAGSTDEMQFSEIHLSWYWRISKNRNVSYGAKVGSTIVADDTLRGNSWNRDRRGITRTVDVRLNAAKPIDLTYFDLMEKSGRTIIANITPTKPNEEKWRNLIVGYAKSKTDSTETALDIHSVTMSFFDSKNIEDI